jgi:hypothetical protein
MSLEFSAVSTFEARLRKLRTLSGCKILLAFDHRRVPHCLISKAWSRASSSAVERSVSRFRRQLSSANLRLP